MNWREYFKRLLSMLLALAIIIGLGPDLSGWFTKAAAAEGDPIYVLAGGDFQAGDNGQEDHYYSRINMGNILDKIKENYSTMNGFIFVGDYDGDTHNDSNANTGVAAMMEEVSKRFNTLNHDNSYLIEGNHETGAVSGIDATGGYDCDGYAVYLINETDFCERQEGKSAQIQTVADNLKTWLNNKIGEGYEAPIFVATHTPLGYTTRTYTNGDSLYGKYVFDVLNDAAANGLNIIFMHGHDHAWGADNYLGGEAIYLPVGDKINICVPGDKTAWTEETLNFTYMNAGYVGYYNEDYYNVNSYEAEKLTMTVFKIENNQVTVERWSKDGLYNLKSKGREGFYNNASTCAEIGLDYNETVYASPQTITLNAAQDYGSTIGSWVGVAAETPADDVAPAAKGWVEILSPVPGSAEIPSTTTYQYSLAINGYTGGNNYLIVGSRNPMAMGNGTLTAVDTTLSDDETKVVLDAQADYEWTITADGKITNGTQYLLFTGNSERAGGGTLSTTTDASAATAWTIRHNGEGDYSVYVSNSYDDDGCSNTENATQYCFLYYNNNNAFTIGTSDTESNTSYTVRLYGAGQEVTTEYVPAVPDTNGTYYRIDGTLTHTVEVGTTAEAALNALKSQVSVYEYEAMSAPGAAVTGTVTTDVTLDFAWVDTYDPNTPGDYEVEISYTDSDGTKHVLGTAEVVVPASTTYYVAEGNGLYIVDMNTSADDAMAAVKAGVTVYSATDANGTNKTAVSDDDVTWNWVDTYNGADSGPYTVEILKDGTSLGTVEVKVNIKYETGLNEGWTAVGTTSGGYRYVLDTDGIDYYDANDATTQYIIVANGAAYAVNGSGGAAAVEISSDGSTVTTTTRDYEYHFIRSTYNNTRYELITKGDGSQYLYQENSALHYGTRSSVKFQINHHGSGVYDIHDIDGTNWYITYNGGWTVTDTTDVRVLLYRYDGEIGGGDIYAMLEGNTVYTVDQGTSATQALAAVKAGITGYISSNADGSDATELNDSELTWKWKNTYASMVTGSYWVEISYNGVVLGTVEVVVKPAVINNYPEYPDEGAVKVNKTATGIDFQSSGIAQVELSASGVSIKKGVDVIIMLDTSSSMAYCLNCTDTRHSTYECDQGGQTRAQALKATLADLITQFKTPGDDGQLLDIDVAIADFNGFNGYGGTSGTPYDRDEDDNMSDDIKYTANGNNALIYTGDNTLGAGAFVAAEDLAATYTLNYDSGTNYDYAFDAIYQMATAKKIANGSEDRDLYVIFMSDGAGMQWNYYHSQGNSSLWNSWITGAWPAAELAANLNCTTHAYYYDEVDHDGDGMRNEHRMANAIKGDPTELYEVIRKTNDLGTATDEENMYMVPGLGAKLFSIAYDPRVDGNVTVDSITKSIESLASEQTGTTQYFYNVSSADELAAAFNVIGAEIAYAASNARFVDKMGDSYNLQLETKTYTVVDGENTTTKTLAPVIEILSYDIYSRQDYLNSTITADQIGDRKGTYTLNEVVKFSDDGTKAYSSLIDVDKDGIYGVTVNSDGTYTISDTDDNIIGTDGIIYAVSFVYNTGTTDVAVDGVKIPTMVNADGTTSGTTNVLPSETFYWNMDTITTTELAMRYYVYLEGSQEGTKEAGSYATNEYAILYYDNYLGNACQMGTTSPTVGWKEASVSYAFYLVNEDGEIIVNQTTGQTGSFAHKIAVTNPVVYETILLNNLGSINSISVADNAVLPTGYELYDNTAVYTIRINSNTTGSWEIKQDSSKVASTYVTQFNPADASDYSHELTNDTVGHDYTHTVVWFAVLWKVQALPDSVVVDYGLPVDIHVLGNDMFGENGELAGVGAYADSLNLDGYDATLASGFGDSYTGTYGTATANTDTGTIRYTLNGMEMNGYEKFAYAVHHTGTTNAGYYYDTVTVIPATTIYYEDNFVTTKSYTWNDGWVEVTKTDAAWTWSQEGTAVNGTQDEDRPGKYSLTDANNIYGYDSVNLNMSTFSMGSALKATVDFDNYAVAEFSFYGTGFDVISMTSNTTGTIVVKVVDVAKNETVKNIIVDTYYGYKTELYNVTYTYTNGEWVKTVGEKAADGATESKVDTTAVGAEGDTETGIEYVWVLDPNADDSIYQVPVIKIENLPYGQYKVEISAMYDTAFDHVDPSYETGSYDFYLDAIRIYDPANDGAADDVLYNVTYTYTDGEWVRTIGTKADEGTTATTPNFPENPEEGKTVTAVENIETTIEDAYVADGEGWPSYLELRNMLIDNNTLGNAATSTVITGLVFIDGDAEVGDAQITDYQNYGPNNEIYLAPGQRVAFILSTPANIDQVHIGLKSADGKPASYTITNVAKAANTETGVTAGAYYGAKTETISTTTDMYYNLTPWANGDIIVISNYTTDTKTTGILSITNIKFTYTSDPNAASAASEENGTAAASYRLSAAPAAYSTLAAADELTVVSNGTETAVSNEGSIYMTAEAAALAVQAVNAMYAPEEPEPEVFEPEKLEISIGKGKVKQGDKVKVTVKTSDDVDYITVNGKTVTRYKTDRRTGDRTWSVELRAEEAGEMTVEVIAYNAEGLASEAVTETLEVQEKKSHRDHIRDFFDWIFG